MPDSDVLQTDRVDHSRFGFPETGGRVAGDGLAGKAFDDESSNELPIHKVFEFDAISKGPRSRQDGSAKRNPA